MLAAVKNYCRVSWNDEDAALEEIIDRGKTKLEELAGAALDFTTEGLARSLLFDYIRYAYNNASEYYAENFAREILRLQLVTGILAQKEPRDAEDAEDGGEEDET